MSTKRRIVVADLETPVRSTVSECLPPDHLDIAAYDKNASVASAARVDRAIFCEPKDLEQTQGLCATLRSRIGVRAPLMCCAGRYVDVLIRRPLGKALQRYDHCAVSRP